MNGPATWDFLEIPTDRLHVECRHCGLCYASAGALGHRIQLEHLEECAGLHADRARLLQIETDLPDLAAKVSPAQLKRIKSVARQILFGGRKR